MHIENDKTMWIIVDKFCAKITKEHLFVDKPLYFMQKRVYIL